MKKSILTLIIGFLIGNLFGQSIQKVTVTYTANGVTTSEDVSAGNSKTIKRDKGTAINIRIYKSSTAPSSCYFMVACINSGLIYERTSTNTSELFSNVGDAITNQIWCTVETNEGRIEILPTDLPTSYPDLSPINRTVDGNGVSTGVIFYVNQSVEIDCDIWNNGSANAGPNRTGFYIGTSPSDFSNRFDYNTTGSSPIQPGYAEHEISDYTFTSSDIGTRYINFWADYQNVIAEGTGEGNNKQSWGPFTVKEPPLFSISGSLMYPDNMAIGGFYVRATNTNNTSLNFDSTPESNYSTGAYTIPNLPTGTYNLFVLNSSDYTITPSFTNPVTVTSSNITGRNFTLAGKGQPSVRIEAPASFTPGQTFPITAYFKNTNYATSALIGYLDVSFPDNPTITVTANSSEFGTPTLYPAGSTLYSSSGTQISSSHILMSAEWKGPIPNQTERYVTMSVTPPANATSIKIRYRGTMAEKRDPTLGTTDQQGWFVNEATVQKANNLIETLYGNIIDYKNIPLFGEQYMIFTFAKQNNPEEKILLPFKTSNLTPLIENFVKDPELAKVLIQKYELQYPASVLDYINLSALRNKSLIELAHYYDLDKWWYSDNSYLPMFKGKVDHVIIGKVSLSASKEIAKAYCTGGTSALGVVGSIISPLANSGALKGVNYNEIQALILAQSIYNGSKSVFKNMPSLIRDYEDFEALSLFVDELEYIKKFKDLSAPLVAISSAAKSGDLTELLLKRNELRFNVESITSGFIFDAIGSLLMNLTGTNDLSEQIDTYSWLTDVHYEAISTISYDCIEAIDTILYLENQPYSISNSTYLSKKYHDLISKHSILIKSLETEMIAVQLRRLTDIRNRFLPGVTDFLGANQSSIDQLRSDYDFYKSDFEDHLKGYNEYLSNTLVNFNSYLGALAVLTNQLTNDNLLVNLVQDNCALVLGQSKSVQLEITNNYVIPITIQSIQFSDQSGNLVYSYNNQPLTLQPNGSTFLEVNINVPRNYFWLHAADPEFLKYSESSIKVNWNLESFNLSKTYVVPHVITSFAKIESVTPTKGIYRPSENITITMKCSGTSGLSGATYAQALLKPDGLHEALQISSLPSNGEAILQMQAPNGPFGAYGFYGQVMQNGDVIIPTTYANRLFYLVPKVDFDITQFEWSNCIIVYPAADLSAAQDIKNILGVPDNRFYKVEDYSVAQLRNYAQSYESILLGGYLANPLVNELDQSLLSKPGDAIIKYYLNAFSGKDVIVVAGWNLRDTEIATMGLLDYYKSNSGFKISGQLAYNNTASTQLNNVSLTLLNTSNAIVGNSVSNASGNFSFSGLSDGFYTIKPNITKPWSGATAMDITSYKKHIGAISLLSNLQAKSGDVNGSNSLTTMDLTIIKQRIGSQISSFSVGDWVYDSPTVTISGSNVTQNIMALCYGDANGSYIPLSTLKSSFETFIASDESVKFINEREFEVPLLINTSASNLSSVTLKFSYPSEMLEVSDITMIKNNEDLDYFVKDNIITVIFSTLNPLYLLEGDILMTIKFLIRNDLNDELFNNSKLYLSGEGEFGTFDDKVLERINLKYCSTYIDKKTTPEEVEIYPNPVSDQITINNVENATISIYNLQGICVLIKKNAQKQETINIVGLSPGTYIINIIKNNRTIARKISIKQD